MKPWFSIRTFLAFVFHRSRIEREMEEEVRVHLLSSPAAIDVLR